MNRQALIDKLSLAQPALASNNILQILTHFWFDGGTVRAFNARIGIRVKLDENPGVLGCVPGNTILGLLKSSSAKDIILKEEKGWVHLKTKVMDAKLSMLPLEGAEQAWDLKEPIDTAKWLGVRANILVPALIKCLPSTTDDTSIPDQLGVTFIPDLDGGGMELYATNDNTITKVRIEGGKLRQRAILSAEFCRQVVALCNADSDKNLAIEIRDTQATLVMDDTTLYGKLILSEKPVAFHKIVNGLFTEKTEKQLIDIPKFLPAALERSLIMAAAGEGEARMTITCKNNRFSCVTSAHVGQDTIGTVHDSIDSCHPDVSAILNPKDMLPALEFYNKMLVTDGALIMTDGADATFLVATMVPS